MRRLINQQPGRGERLALGLLPFILLAGLYVFASQLRLAENPDDKLLPSLASMGERIADYAFNEDVRSGRILLW